MLAPETHKVQNTSIVNANEFLSLPIVAEAFMERITSAELVRDFSRHTDTARCGSYRHHAARSRAPRSPQCGEVS
jgi:hypothetical protein